MADPSCLAHRSSDGERCQTVQEHLTGTAERAAEFGAAFGCAEQARWVGLLHDIGKVESRCRGNRENDRQSHYYGHPQVSARIVKQQIIPRLLQSDRTMDDQMVHDLVWLVEHHDDALPSECSRVKRIREKIGGRLFQMWMELQIADARAHVILPKVLNRIVICEKWLAYTD